MNTNQLKIIAEYGLGDVKVFQICECDAVAAYTLDEAIDYYKELTGVSDEELYHYDEIEIVSPDLKVYEDEERTGLVTVKELVERYWDNKPCIMLSTEV
ncbi:hypothetical protein J2T12_005083 [Paenibacillus anaericanus]|uniref:hypothetical protein n=1 Tax=Paenibacillus anaericanus TaxID=170367 RepID=UPI002789A493|nr:hypothetical protein [Paenibacillus anaericanus]MDQ0091643.1 hypothetical protein [Paenibacillus anaericanus]